MSGISIIGLGSMTRVLGALALVGGNTVEVIGRDAARAADLASTWPRCRRASQIFG